MTGDDWDFQVERIDLDGLDIDAGQRLGVVVVQPNYEVEADGAVPFQISAAYRAAQKDLIEKAFQIRAAESEERNVPIPFVLFPEISIPARNPEGLDCLRQQVERVQGDVIFIGGLEGLTGRELEALVNAFPPNIEIARPDFDAAGAFVNACVIAVKPAGGELGWHFQAKVVPSQWEQGRNMARGKRVLYFVAPRLSFVCQICFDHIAAQGREPLNPALCRRLIEKTQPDAATLDFVFVPQYNPQPDATSFRQNTGRLLNHQHRAFKNDMTAIVVANRAASVQEPSKYGRSGFHYKAGRWQIPNSDVGPKSYELCDSDVVTSAVFRKRTRAIHVTTLVPASHNVGNSGNLRRPLENPRSYLIGEECDAAQCSCLPGTPCEVGRFVECDCLPCKLHDSLLRDLPNTDSNAHRWTGADDNQSALLVLHYDEIRQRLLVLSCKRAADLLDLLFFHRQGGKGNPDTWEDTVQVDAVRELAAAMSVLRERGRIDFNSEACWTAVLEDGFAVSVLDGDNTFSCRDLAAKYLQQYGDYACKRRSHPVLIVALRSTGRVDPIVEEFQPRYSEPRNRGPFEGSSPYEPARMRAFVCRDDLFQNARRAPVLGDFLGDVMESIRA